MYLTLGFILTTCLVFSKAELFTAVVDLQRLLDTEKSIASLLDSYLEVEEERISQLRFFRDNYDRIHKIASQDSESYLSNPVNAYLLVKRLTTDWKAVESLVVSRPAETGRAAIANLTSRIDYVTSFPSAEDLSGAAAALIRLQQTYKLDTSAIARGQIPIPDRSRLKSRDAKSTSDQLELTAGDCFELGRHSYTSGDYYHTVLWMQESLHRVQNEHPKSADVAEILEYLAFSTFKQGNIAEALKLTDRLLQLIPYHQRALGNRDYYLSILNSESQEKRGDDGDVLIDALVQKTGDEPKELTERKVYESLCRGEKRMSTQTQSSLRCFYWRSKHPALTISRVKVEEAFKKPLVLLFHDVISDPEMQKIKDLSGPRLKRATVQNSQTGQLETASYRISKSSWLKNSDDEVVDRVSRRIEQITGLTTETAEELQVVNYGIGGHYDVHFDFARKEETNAFQNLGTGNRIATWMFYMSHVEAGGATVFPELGVTIWPTKGGAAFWYNLHPDGEGDMMTRHAACPVLVGSKWVANKWFHERGHEFIRPCGLKINS